MRELLQSILRFSWATTLFGARQFARMAKGNGSAGAAFERASGAAAAELEGSMRALYHAGARFPNSVAPDSSEAAAAPPESGRLNATTFVVMGEGLAAGMGDFTLSSDMQAFSFAAQIAGRMGVEFPQRLIEPPGIGSAPGFAQLPVIVPSPLQSTVIDRIPPRRPLNLSVPGYTVADAVHRRVSQPLVNKADTKQTMANFILGLPDLAYGKTVGGAQLEYALALSPTFALVELGFAEMLEAALAQSTDVLPDTSEFVRDYSTIVRALTGAGAEVLLLTIPDPFDTAHFPPCESAAETAKVPLDSLRELWQVEPDHRLSLSGLNEIGFQIFSASIGPLPPGSVVNAATVGTLQRRLHEWNEKIQEIGEECGTSVYDLHRLIRRVKERGAEAGQRILTADYLGGFYGLNGYFPGAAGHAVIANAILEELNLRFGASFPPVDVAQILKSDPAGACRPAGGESWKPCALREMAESGKASRGPERIAAVGRRGSRTFHSGPLQLPPGLEQVLPLNKDLSYFGDGIAALNCRSAETIKYGSGGSLLFGGLVMVDSHLSGNIRIKFSPPVNGCSRFEIFFEEGFSGDDEVLEAPTFFKMAFRNNRVDEIPGFISSGTLNLATGGVDTSKGTFNLFAQYSSTGLNALVSVNPTFPRPPKAPLSFPGQYGSACVVFEQRQDGLLDFTFVGTTFVPLGPGIVWPLNFCSPASEFATIPANGTVMHPHLALSTRETPPSDVRAGPIEIPTNALREYTLFAPISSFGDVFTLSAPQLGGPATGRSRLLGRVQVQFGPRCGTSVPVALSTTTAGGTLVPMDPTPLAQLFPGRLTPGPLGFYENLRFPLRTYSLNDLAIIDDPFDIAVGSVDIRTGKLCHPLLHRSFINQDLIFALLRVEPYTPQNSFMFRGPAGFINGCGASPAFEFYGQVHIPYPPGFAFPDPNLATGFPIGGASALDPYLWLWALPEHDPGDVVARGHGQKVSSRFETFTYRYEIPSRPGIQEAVFEYDNLSQQGKFRMHSLAWVSFGISHTASEEILEYDTLTFTGFGVWQKNGVERVLQATVQVSTSPKAPYIGIQIGAGDVSNVNTAMPPDAFPVRPAEPGGYMCCIGL